MVDINAWVERTMADIRKDAADGVIPAKPAGFQQLHDFVDANEYYLDTMPDGCDLIGDEWDDACNAVIGEVDRRLQAAHQ